MAERAPLAAELVREFVSSAHGDVGRVRELLEDHPTLVNASWDWGGGDWETALGAAAHVGRRDIARLLLDHGGRMDIFVAAMLGQIDVVQAILAAFPDAPTWHGPHGIPLLAHARAGGVEAAAVVDFLAGRAR